MEMLKMDWIRIKPKKTFWFDFKKYEAGREYKISRSLYYWLKNDKRLRGYILVWTPFRWVSVNVYEREKDLWKPKKVDRYQKTLFEVVK